MAKSWNLDGLYRHAQGVKERGRRTRGGQGAKAIPRTDRECPHCHQMIADYFYTHLSICDKRGDIVEEPDAPR